MGFHPDSTSRTSPLRRALASLATRRAAIQSSTKTSAAVRRAARDVVQQLEGRTLFAVVSAGETAFYYNGTNSYKITVTGSGSFTFTAAVHPPLDTTNGGGGAARLAEVPMTVFNSANGQELRDYSSGYLTTVPTGAPTGFKLPLFDIYSIYSSDTTANTSLAIVQYTPPTPGVSGFSTPFTGTAGTIRTAMTDPGQDPLVAVSLANGGVFIGGRENGEAAGTDPVFSLVKNGSIATGPNVGLSSNKSYQPGIYLTGLNNKPASLDNLFIDGTITGRVMITGSVNTFYAGNILTGDPVNGNVSSKPVSNVPGNGTGAQNFRIGGDLRNLIVAGGIGTVGASGGASSTPDAFIPGTDLSIGGRVQQIKTGVEFRGSIDVGGATGTYTDGSDLTEIETRVATNSTERTAGSAFDSFKLLTVGGTAAVGLGIVNNDTFATPQILGSYKSDTTGAKGQITLTGSINNGPRVLDDADYYGVPLLAGQTITVKLDGLGAAYVGVYDPDGRLIATDQSNQNDIDFINQSISITAKTAGLFRVAALPVTPATRVGVPRPYTLTINKIGDVGIGGLVSTGNVQFTNLDVGYRVRNADMGGILAGGAIYGAASTDLTAATVNRDAQFDNPITTDVGNIRSIVGNTLSLRGDGGYLTPPNIIAAKSVGRIQATDYCYFNSFAINTSTQQPSSNATIGGDYQVIQAGGDFSANLSADGGIGVIRAGSIASGTITNPILGAPGYFGINADGKGDDGFIGLIDVAGDLGSFTYGGPAISAGRGSSSNVKYMRVGGDAYRDLNTGQGLAISTIADDSSTTIVDDSGADVTIYPIVGEAYDNTPDTTTGSTGNDTTAGSAVNDTVIGSNGNNPIGTNPNVPNPIGTTDTTGGSNGSDPVDTRPRSPSGRLLGGFLTIGAYPTRNGGSVIYRVTADDYLTTDPRSIGVEIVTTGTASNASGDIGEIITGNNNAAQVVDPNATVPNERPNSKSTLDQSDIGTNEEILISGIQTNVFDIHGTTGLSDYTNISNGTSGEIVNITADSIVSLEANYLGVSRPAGGVTLDGLNNAGTAAQNVYPFNQAKNLIDVGNAISIKARGPLGNIFATNIQSLQANSDGRNVKGLLEGIVGPVVATNSIFRTDIGEGLATSGSGETSTGGLYASNTLGLVSNDLGNGDVRGDVLAGNYIEGIRLNGGASILDADVLQFGNGTTGTGDAATFTGFATGLETNSFLVNSAQNPLINGVGDIRVLGTGGIINSSFRGQNFGTTTVAPTGFGVLNSSFLSAGGGNMKGLIAGGLGIRNSEYVGGATVGDVVATGGGALIDINSLPASIRGSDSGYYDPATGIGYNAANDVYRFFNTSSEDSKITGTTNSGIIADTRIVSSKSINSVRAFEFRTFVQQTLNPTDESFPNTINFANSIGTISAKKNINGLRVVGGSIGTISAGGTISNFQLQARARVETVIAKKNVLGSANFNVTDEGSIGSFGVNGYMNGTISSAQGIGSLIIDGDVRSSRSQGGIYTAGTIELLKIGGDVLDTTYIRAKKSIKSLTINGDFQSGAVIRASKFSKKTIRGSNDGTLQVG